MCESCGKPGAKRTSFGDVFCNPCFDRKQETKSKNGNGAGIG